MNLKNMLSERVIIKDHIVYDSKNMKCPEEANPQTEKGLVVA